MRIDWRAGPRSDALLCTDGTKLGHAEARMSHQILPQKALSHWLVDKAHTHIENKSQQLQVEAMLLYLTVGMGELSSCEKCQASQTANHQARDATPPRLRTHTAASVDDRPPLKGLQWDPKKLGRNIRDLGRLQEEPGVRRFVALGSLYASARKTYPLGIVLHQRLPLPPQGH